MLSLVRAFIYISALKGRETSFPQAQPCVWKSAARLEVSVPTVYICGLPLVCTSMCAYAHACVYTRIFLSTLMCTCGEGCMLVLIPCDRPVLIAALLVCLGWHQKWHRRVANRLNTRLTCPYPVSLCLTHNTLTGLPVRLSVCTFLIEFKPLPMLPPLSELSHSVWERMKHLGARPVPAFCDCTT